MERKADFVPVNFLEESAEAEAGWQFLRRVCAREAQEFQRAARR
jgi:hypothetical protein